MLLVRLLLSSWLSFRGLQHSFRMDPRTNCGFVYLAVQVDVWIPIFGWRSLAIRQDPDWQHVSLFTVYNASYETLQRLVAVLDQAMHRSCDGAELELLYWQTWPVYSTNALIWPSYHSSIIGLLSGDIVWYSSYTYHVVV